MRAVSTTVVPLLVGHGRGGAGAADAAGVDQDVYLSEVGNDVLNAGRDGGCVAQVYVMRIHLYAIFCGDLLGVIFKLIGPARNESHVGARIGHGLCKLQAQPGRAAGDKGHLTGKVKNIVFHTCSLLFFALKPNPQAEHIPHYMQNYKRL